MLSPFELRQTQILTLIALCGVNDRGQLTLPEQNTVVQVKTGEGKSLIIACLAVIRRIHHRYVDVITSSPLLAARDAAEFASFYNIFGLTVGHNSDSSFNPMKGKPKRCYKHDIVYGDIREFQFDRLRHEFNCLDTLGERVTNSNCVIVDEVDSMLLDGTESFAMLAETYPGMEQLRPLYVAMWTLLKKALQLLSLAQERERNHTGSPPIQWDKLSAREVDLLVRDRELRRQFEGTNDVSLLQKAVESLDEFLVNSIHAMLVWGQPASSSDEPQATFDSAAASDLIFIPQRFQGMINRMLKRWARAARHAMGLFIKERDYLVADNGREIWPVDYLSTGVTQRHTQWCHGVHQFIQIKEGVGLSPETLTTNFMSNRALLQKYTLLSGLTGTLGSEKERELLEEAHNIKTTIIPSAWRKKFVLYTPTFVTASAGPFAAMQIQRCYAHEEPWMKSLLIAINREVAAGRALLILCRSIQEARFIYRMVREHTDAAVATPYYRSDETSSSIITERFLQPGEVVIATNLAGRGTDFKLSEQVLACGGLHLILTFVPSNLRVEEQALGRVARQGQPGSAQYILFDVNPTATFRQVITNRNRAEEERLEEILSVQLPRMETKDNAFALICELLRNLRDMQQMREKAHLRGSISRAMEAAKGDLKLQAVTERWGWLFHETELNFEDWSNSQSSSSRSGVNDAGNPWHTFVRRIAAFRTEVIENFEGDSKLDDTRSTGEGDYVLRIPLFDENNAYYLRYANSLVALRHKLSFHLRLGLHKSDLLYSHILGACRQITDPLYMGSASSIQAYTMIAMKGKNYKAKAQVHFEEALIWLEKILCPRMAAFLVACQSLHGSSSGLYKQVAFQARIAEFQRSQLNQQIGIIRRSEREVIIRLLGAGDSHLQWKGSILKAKKTALEFEKPPYKDSQLRLEFNNLRVDTDLGKYIRKEPAHLLRLAHDLNGGRDGQVICSLMFEDVNSSILCRLHRQLSEPQAVRLRSFTNWQVQHRWNEFFKTDGPAAAENPSHSLPLQPGSTPARVSAESTIHIEDRSLHSEIKGNDVEKEEIHSGMNKWLQKLDVVKAMLTISFTPILSSGVTSGAKRVLSRLLPVLSNVDSAADVKVSAQSFTVRVTTTRSGLELLALRDRVLRRIRMLYFQIAEEDTKQNGHGDSSPTMYMECALSLLNLDRRQLLSAFATVPAFYQVIVNLVPEERHKILKIGRILEEASFIIEQVQPDEARALINGLADHCKEIHLNRPTPVKVETDLLPTALPQDIDSLKINGTEFFFYVQEKRPMPYLTVALLGAVSGLELVAGLTLATLTSPTGYGSALGFGIVGESIGTMAFALRAASSRNISWRSFAASKIASYLITFGTAGVAQVLGGVAHGAHVESIIEDTTTFATRISHGAMQSMRHGGTAVAATTHVMSAISRVTASAVTVIGSIAGRAVADTMFNAPDRQHLLVLQMQDRLNDFFAELFWTKQGSASPKFRSLFAVFRIQKSYSLSLVLNHLTRALRSCFAQPEAVPIRKGTNPEAFVDAVLTSAHAPILQCFQQCYSHGKINTWLTEQLTSDGKTAGYEVKECVELIIKELAQLDLINDGYLLADRVLCSDSSAETGSGAPTGEAEARENFSSEIEYSQAESKGEEVQDNLTKKVDITNLLLRSEALRPYEGLLHRSIGIIQEFCAFYQTNSVADEYRALQERLRKTVIQFTLSRLRRRYLEIGDFVGEMAGCFVGSKLGRPFAVNSLRLEKLAMFYAVGAGASGLINQITSVGDGFRDESTAAWQLNAGFLGRDSEAVQYFGTGAIGEDEELRGDLETISRIRNLMEEAVRSGITEFLQRSTVSGTLNLLLFGARTWARLRGRQQGLYFQVTTNSPRREALLNSLEFWDLVAYSLDPFVPSVLANFTNTRVTSWLSSLITPPLRMEDLGAGGALDVGYLQHISRAISARPDLLQKLAQHYVRHHDLPIVHKGMRPHERQNAERLQSAWRLKLLTAVFQLILSVTATVPDEQGRYVELPLHEFVAQSIARRIPSIGAFLTRCIEERRSPESMGITLSSHCISSLLQLLVAIGNEAGSHQHLKALLPAIERRQYLKSTYHGFQILTFPSVYQRRLSRLALFEIGETAGSYGLAVLAFPLVLRSWYLHRQAQGSWLYTPTLFVVISILVNYLCGGFLLALFRF